MQKKNVPPLIRIGDFVSFHTQYGQTVGIVENISLRRKPYQEAEITVRNLSNKPRRYTRPLFKLKRVNLVD